MARIRKLISYPQGNQTSAARKGFGMKVPKSLIYNEKPDDLILGKVK